MWGSLGRLNNALTPLLPHPHLYEVASDYLSPFPQASGFALVLGFTTSPPLRGEKWVKHSGGRSKHRANAGGSASLRDLAEELLEAGEVGEGGLGVDEAVVAVEEEVGGEASEVMIL